MFRKIKQKAGFTLIELLIVIALLGALAVGLLAALDPFEQLKKGTDTGVRNTVSEIHGAIIRYYGITNYMPWCSDPNTCGTEPTGVFASADPVDSALDAIIAAGELKSEFKELAGTGVLGKISVTGNNALGTVSVCYAPTAKSFRSDPNTHFDVNGADDATCPDAAAADCYWCIQ